MPSDGIVDLGPVIERLWERYHHGDDTATTRARAESAALSLMTDEQALATWERLKAARKAYVAAILAEVAE